LYPGNITNAAELLMLIPTVRSKPFLFFFCGDSDFFKILGRSIIAITGINKIALDNEV
jgi:hypothetical protein